LTVNISRNITANLCEKSCTHVQQRPTYGPKCEYQYGGRHQVEFTSGIDLSFWSFWSVTLDHRDVSLQTRSLCSNFMSIELLISKISSFGSFPNLA